MSGLQDLHVLQEDMGSDAVTFENTKDGVTYLFISPTQSFESAVASVIKACPELTLPEVQELIRKHCPDIHEMNVRLGAVQEPIPRFDATYDVAPVPTEDKGAHRRVRAPKWARIAAVAAPALVGGTLIAHFFSPAATGGQGSSGTGTTISQTDAASVFDDPTYKQYVADGNLRCQPVGPYAAKCVDEDGQTMLSEASVGDSVVFTFSYDSEKVGFRVFENANEAKMWMSEDGNRRLYDNMRVAGRVVLWGTDTKRLEDWVGSLSTQSANQASVMGHTLSQSVFGALPPRLASLALGTLGVSGKGTPKAPAGSIHAAQTLRAVELVMGVTDDGDDRGNVPVGSSDAVAIAADAPRPPVWGTGNWVGPRGAADSTPVSEPAASPPQPATPATVPSTPAAVPPESVASEPPATEPVAPQPEVPVDAPQPEPAPVVPASGELAPTDPAPVDQAPAESGESVPADPEAVDQAPADPAPTEPAEATPATPELPEPAAPVVEEPVAAEEAPAPSDTAEEDGGSDDLLILDSSWTVGV